MLRRLDSAEEPPLSDSPSRAIAARVDIRTKTFERRDSTKDVLTDLSFEVYQGEFLAILGPSGCGKTTLLRILAGLDTRYEGSVTEADSPVTGPSRYRTLLFQEPRLLPWLRVNANISFALPAGVSRIEKRDRVSKILDLVGLAGSANARPSDLSGGMAKRVALARSLVNLPRLLLLDEPFGGLDVPTRYGLHDRVAEIHERDTRLTTVLVTHDIHEAVYLSDRLLILSPTHTHVVSELGVALPRPRSRETALFRSLCSSVMDAVVDAWSHPGS